MSIIDWQDIGENSATEPALLSRTTLSYDRVSSDESPEFPDPWLGRSLPASPVVEHEDVWAEFAAFANQRRRRNDAWQAGWESTSWHDDSRSDSTNRRWTEEAWRDDGSIAWSRNR